MDEIWERAVETALDGQTDHASIRTLTLDGAVKCLHGRLPPPSLLERFQNLQHLSIANIGVSSLEQFPRLRNLEKLILSDNRIAGGLEHLVEAGLDSLRDLDLSNNRIQYIEDLAPLAQLKLVSLDLYECPVTRVKDYRSRVFALIKSLKYLDKMDADENEWPESDEEEEEEDEDDDDPGSGEIDGEDRPYRASNGHSEVIEGVVDADEDEESDADEEETETAQRVNGQRHQANGFHVAPVLEEDGEEDDDEDDEENESGEEIDEEGEDDDVVEVHEIDDSDEDGIEFDEDDEDDEDDEGVDNDEVDLAEPESTGLLTSTEGEIDAHEQGEDDVDEDDNGETGEDEQGLEQDGNFEDEEGDDEEEDSGEGYLVQPVAQAEEDDADADADVGGSDMDAGNEEGDDGEEEEEVEDDKDDVQVISPSSSHLKRKRDEDVEEGDDDGKDDGEGDDDGKEDEEDDDDGKEDEEDDDVVEYSKSSKKHH